MELELALCLEILRAQTRRDQLRLRSQFLPVFAPTETEFTSQESSAPRDMLD